MTQWLSRLPAGLQARRGFRLWLPPRRILYPKTRSEWPGYVKHWPLLGCPGRWDRFDHLHPPFREQELREILLEQVDFRATRSYARLRHELETMGRTRFPRCESPQEIEAYFKGLRRLYESMRDHGYQPSEVMGAKGDIDVRISRKGELLKCGQGTHRLAVARILGLPRILVRVDLIHTGFLRRLGNPAAADLKPRMIDYFSDSGASSPDLPEN
ncbi:hypothetical protein CKO35_04070 [Ectothiorhodospira shaposhnikovii]|uniref:hypothetical protein n=1 Tax=Ectothiorhodospira shaposhnikovii TaxID=1054 RepID=UPI001908E437|nr:hypothetical protein [Ectothiorhodospira shaposhnikovii]MBK1672485.1 hypothetical protein [Ectothiorhodospira shaposhnikovii]